MQIIPVAQLQRGTHPPPSSDRPSVLSLARPPYYSEKLRSTAGRRAPPFTPGRIDLSTFANRTRRGWSRVRGRYYHLRYPPPLRARTRIPADAVVVPPRAVNLIIRARCVVSRQKIIASAWTASFVSGSSYCALRDNGANESYGGAHGVQSIGRIRSDRRTRRCRRLRQRELGALIASMGW